MAATMTTSQPNLTASDRQIVDTDPISGYCASTRIYKNHHPPPPLPPESTPLNIADFAISLLRTAFPDPTSLDSLPFLIDSSSSQSISFSHFIRQVNSLSSSLTDLSIDSGDVAIVLSPTSLAVPVLYFSLLSLGAVLSPVNPLVTDSELADITRMVSPAAVFTVSSLANRVPSRLRTILLDSPDFPQLLLPRPKRSAAAAAVSQSDTAVILYSSGTTGRMKGVEISHRAMIASIAGNHDTLLRRSGCDGPERERVVNLFTVPLFHIYGLYFLIWAAAAGETAVLRVGRFDLEGMVNAVERYGVTTLPASPPVIVAMVKKAEEVCRGRNLRSLRTVVCGGAPLGPEVVARFMDKFPWVSLAQGYGLTEVGGSVTKFYDEVDPDHYGSVGKLTEVLEAKIIDPPTGESLPPHKAGELWLRGPSLMKGYFGNEEATKATFDKDGWLKTGDLCYFDDQGYLFIVDRLKELIKFKGYQVPPAELEHWLLGHPEIADAAVIPYPDEDAGQIPMAFVVCKPGSNLSAEQVMSFVAKQVSPYKKVRKVSFISAIPKSPAGKILRRELVNQAVSASSAWL